MIKMEDFSRFIDLTWKLSLINLSAFNSQSEIECLVYV